MPYIPAVNYSKSGAPDAPDTHVITINQFSGTDLTNRSSLMSPSRSPDCRNMMRASPGKVKRRMGYESVGQYDGRINGATSFEMKNGDRLLTVHAGTKVYHNGAVIAGSRAEAIAAHESGEAVTDTGVADARSCIVRMKTVNGTCLLDGTALRHFVYADHLETGDRIYFCPRVSDSAYVPTVMIDRDPIGGGTAHEDINLMSDAFTELFFSDGTSTVYQISLDELDESKGTTVKTMNEDGLTWTQLTEGTDYSVDYVTGRITFAAAPAQTPVSGQSNVSITASKDRSEKRSWIDKCTIGICFGDTDTGSRLFVTGNPDYPNRDFWSELDNPSYFSDLNYSILGSLGSNIVGYSMLGDQLATHKSDGTIYVRSAVTDENNMYRQYFPVTSVIRGPRSIAPYSFATLNSEPLFLTESGIYALTSADLTAEKYAQRRSFYLDGTLLKESDLSECYALVYRDMYLLAVNGAVYVLDGTEKTYAKDEPHSTYQYESFYWTGIPARCMWLWDGALHFGDDDGNVYRFSEELYTDNGQPFTACWQTPELQGASFYHYKHMKRMAMQLAPGEAVSVDISANTGKGWGALFSHDFAASDAARVLVRRLKLNKCAFAAFRIQSSGAQPFEPDVINIEYTQTSRHDKRL